jgi:hypothetical protein
MLGTQVDPEQFLNFTELNFTMSPINRTSHGNLTWSDAVNLTFVKEHWDEMFDVYIKNVTFRKHNTSMALLDFNITTLHDDNRTMTYQATFHKPYMLGLLMKKSDKLYIHLKYDLLDIKGYFRE